MIKRDKLGRFTKENKNRLGTYHTKKAKEKNRLFHFGKKYSKETNLKKGLKGERNGNWKGGIMYEPYSKRFNEKLKEQIRKRDNYRCQECRFTQEQLKRKLDIHHIDFNKKNSNPNNLISLCHSCHMQTQMNREDWTNYFQDKIKC